MEFNYKLIKDISLFTLCGVLCFSPISALFFNAIGIDATINEFFLFLFSPFLASRLNLTLELYSLFYGLILIVFLTVLALLIGDFPIYSILSTSRGYILLLLGFAYSLNSHFKIEDLKYIFLGSVLGWLYRTIDLIKEIKIGNDESIIANGNLLGLFGVVFLLLNRGYSKLISISCIFCVTYLAIFSGSRRSVFVIGLAIIIYFIFNLNRLKSWVILLITISAVLLSLQNLIEILDSINPLMRFRLVDKFVNLASNDSDQIRVSFVNNWLSGLYTEIFPSGFISKRTYNDSGAGNYMDFPISELTKTFGLILVVPSFLFFLYKLSILFKRHIVGHSDNSIYLAFGVLFLVLLFIEGSFLNYSFITPMTGLILGKILKNKNEIA